MGHLCKFCNKTFTKKYNLKRHVETIHSLFSIQDNIQNFICYHCSQSFHHKSSLVRHLVYCKSSKKKRQTKIIPCCLCEGVEIPKRHILQHYNNIHGLNMTIEKLNFISLSEFESWKNKLETNTVSKYSRYDKKMNQKNILHYYHCYRDGVFTSKGKNKRHSKTLGSNKIGGHCPAKIRVSESLETGKISIDFLPTHVGHSDDNIERIPLKKSERETLAAKIQQNIPFDEILSQIRATAIGNELKRIHLVTRKDLFNIKQEFNIQNDVINNPTSLETWITQSYKKSATPVVRFYKKQGAPKEDCDYIFEDNDFLLLIMNDGQLEVLKKYGNDCIYINSIDGQNPCNSHLTTIMVLDDFRQAFPCMFAFSNRSDTHIFQITFDVLKTHLKGETLTPNVFMSDIDIANTFQIAWTEIMGPVKQWVYCSWHVNRAWKNKVLAKVKNSEQQETLYRILQTLLKETNQEAFEVMLQASLKEFDSNIDWKCFGAYFRENFVGNQSAWAHCYQQHLAINTNMSIEPMQRTLEYFYLKGISTGRLDKTINGIMKMVRDRLYERLLIHHKGNISKKLKGIRQRHKSANQIQIDDSLIVTNEDGTWTMRSSRVNEFYTIEISNNGCTCALRCEECDACSHSYICTCLDSAVKWNMCKHIHTICMYLKSLSVTANLDHITEQIMEDDDQSDDLNKYILINGNPKCEEQHVILSLSQSIHSSSDVDKRKSRILETVQSYLNAATTIEQCEVIESALFPIRSTIFEIQSNPPPLIFHNNRGSYS